MECRARRPSTPTSQSSRGIRFDSMEQGGRRSIGRWSALVLTAGLDDERAGLEHVGVDQADDDAVWPHLHEQCQVRTGMNMSDRTAAHQADDAAVWPHRVHQRRDVRREAGPAGDRVEMEQPSVEQATVAAGAESENQRESERTERSSERIRENQRIRRHHSSHQPRLWAPPQWQPLPAQSTLGANGRQRRHDVGQDYHAPPLLFKTRLFPPLRLFS